MQYANKMLCRSLTDDWINEHHSDRVVHGPLQLFETMVNGYIQLTEHSYNGTSLGGSPAPFPGCYQQQQLQLSPFARYATDDQQLQFANRRSSIAGSFYSLSTSLSSEVENVQKGRCPYPDCGKVYKGLKAHLLTHQHERPEKCLISTCEYTQKGFARKYDKRRHVLTHYKGTMVCGFCPGSGSVAEKSFNQVDMFKRHLTSVHGVKQTATNNHKRSPITSVKKLTSYCQDTTGKCSICSVTFSNAQDFYDHLDDCVLQALQQEEPTEAINAQHLASVSCDKTVQEFFDHYLIKIEEKPTNFDDGEEDEDEGDEAEDSPFARSSKDMIMSKRAAGSARAVVGTAIHKSKRGKEGMNRSNSRVTLVGKRRRKRKHYPPSWGMSAEKMRMKKRVLCVYDGERQLCQDDMMLHNGLEVRMKLPDGKSYVTHLDVETLKRADALHSAADAEKGPQMLSDMSPEVYLSPAFVHQQFVN